MLPQGGVTFRVKQGFEMLKGFYFWETVTKNYLGYNDL